MRNWWPLLGLAILLAGCGGGPTPAAPTATARAADASPPLLSLPTAAVSVEPTTNADIPATQTRGAAAARFVTPATATQPPPTGAGTAPRPDPAATAPARRFTAAEVLAAFRAAGLRADDPTTPGDLDRTYPGRPAGDYAIVAFLPGTGPAAVPGLRYAHLWIARDDDESAALLRYLIVALPPASNGATYAQYRHGNAILAYALDTGAAGRSPLDPYVATFLALR